MQFDLAKRHDDKVIYTAFESPTTNDWAGACFDTILLQCGSKLIWRHRICELNLKDQVPSFQNCAPAIPLHQKPYQLAHTLYNQFFRHLHYLRLRAEVLWECLTAVGGQSLRILRERKEWCLDFAGYTTNWLREQPTWNPLRFWQTVPTTSFTLFSYTSPVFFGLLYKMSNFNVYWTSQQKNGCNIRPNVHIYEMICNMVWGRNE